MSKSPSETGRRETEDRNGIPPSPLQHPRACPGWENEKTPFDGLPHPPFPAANPFAPWLSFSSKYRPVEILCCIGSFLQRGGGQRESRSGPLAGGGGDSRSGLPFAVCCSTFLRGLNPPISSSLYFCGMARFAGNPISLPPRS